MTDDEINKRIHELLGMCQHEYKPYNHKGIYACSYCADLEQFAKVNIDFTTSWEGYGILIEWWMKQPQLQDKFIDWLYEMISTEYEIRFGYKMPNTYFWMYCFTTIYGAERYLISPLALAEATVRFFKEDK